MAFSVRDLATGGRRSLPGHRREKPDTSRGFPVVRGCRTSDILISTPCPLGRNIPVAAGSITAMDDQQLTKLRTIFAEIEAERKRQRSRGMLGRVRKTVALLRAHAQRWHFSPPATKTENNAKKGERVRALCTLLMRTDDPVVLENLSVQLRQAIDEYVRSAVPRRSFEFMPLNRELDRNSSIRPAA